MKTLNTSMKRSTLKTLRFLGLCLVLSLVASPMYGQSTTRTVKGVVTSLDGPVYGATVVLKGTNTGVVSGENGEFTFPTQLNENEVLVVSYLGYETSEVRIKGNTTFVRPFLEDIPIVIVAALRTNEETVPLDKNEN